MPVVDDLTEAISRFADVAQYEFLKMVAEALWWLIKAAILLAYQINVIDRWLTETAFPPLLQSTSEGSRVAASMMFVIALLILGMTYMMAVWLKLNVVTPRKAFLWFLAGTLFFQFAPQLYTGFHSMRTALASGFFAAGLDGVDQGGNPFAEFGQVTDADPLVPYDLCDNFGPYFTASPGGAGVHQQVRGTDVALAFLRANGHDVMGYSPPYPNPGGGYCGSGPFVQRELPQWWLEKEWALGGYFYEERDSDSFDDYGPNGRRESIDNAFLGVRRLVASIPLVIMGVIESLIFLLLTLAEGMIFLSFGVAVVFSYFNRTEIIAMSVIDQMIQLMVQTVVIALIQSIIMGLTFAASSTPNPFLILGMGTLALVMMSILLWSGVKMLLNSVNGLFQAIGQVTGGTFVTPTQAAVGMAGIAAGGGLVAGGAMLLGGSMLGGAMGSDKSDGQSFASRALRGSNNLFRTGTYATVAATGNPRLGQLAQMGMMLNHSIVEQPAPASRSGSHSSTPQYPPQYPPAPVPPAPYTPTPFTPPAPQISIPAIPAGQPSLAPQRQGTFIPQSPTPIPNAPDQTLAQGNTASPTPVTPPFTTSVATTMPSSAPTPLPVSSGANVTPPSQVPTAPIGTLQVARPAGVASVLGDAMPTLYQTTDPAKPIRYPQVAEAISQAMGMTPITPNPMRGDMSAVTGFLNQAVVLGMSGRQVQGVVQAVQQAPDHQLPAPQRQALQAYAERQLPPQQARQSVQTLLTLARALPEQLTAYGSVPSAPISPIPTTNTITPTIQVRPQVTVNPIIQPSGASASDNTAPSKRHSPALKGSQRLTGE